MTSRRRAPAWAGLALLLAGLAPSTSHGFEGVDAQLFEPPADPFGYVTVDGARTLDGSALLHLGHALLGPTIPPGESPIALYGAAYFHHAITPQQVATRPDRPSREVLDDVSEVDLVLGLGLLRRVQLGVVLPIVVWRDGKDIDDPTSDLRVSGIGSLRTEVKVEVVERGEDDLVGFAVSAFAKWPTGRERDLSSDDERPTLGGVAILELQVSRSLRLGLNLGYEYLSGDIDFLGVTVDDKLHHGLGIALDVGRLLDIEAVRGIEVVAEVHGWTRIEHPFGREDESPLEVGGAARYGGPTLFVLAGGSAGLSEGVGSPEGRVFAAIGASLR
jgi:hypothetical protein